MSVATETGSVRLQLAGARVARRTRRHADCHGPPRVQVRQLLQGRVPLEGVRSRIKVAGQGAEVRLAHTIHATEIALT